MEVSAQVYAICAHARVRIGTRPYSSVDEAFLDVTPYRALLWPHNARALKAHHHIRYPRERSVSANGGHKLTPRLL